MVAGGVALSGCAGRGPGLTAPAGGALRDLGPAVRVAADAVDMAILTYEQEPGGVHVYGLIGVRDEPGELRVVLGAGGEPVSIECSVGHFGEPDRERSLERALRDRLAALEAGAGAAATPDR